MCFFELKGIHFFLHPVTTSEISSINQQFPVAYLWFESDNFSQFNKQQLIQY